MQMMGNALRFASCLVLAVAVGLLVGCTKSNGVVEAVEVRTAVYPTGGGTTVVIELERGAIEIQGESGGNEIGVTATLRARGATSEEAEESLETVDFMAARIADGLHLGLRVPNDGTVGHVELVAVMALYSLRSRATRTTSSSIFSVIALPICTAPPESVSLSLVNSAELKVAPWIPSRPVRPPMVTM